MGGHGSDNGTTQAQNFNQADIDAFAKSDAAKGLDPQHISQLGTAQEWNQGFFNSTDAGAENISDAANAFLTWRAAQSTSASSYVEYSNLATAQQGRQSTVIGAQATPGTILGAQ